MDHAIQAQGARWDEMMRKTFEMRMRSIKTSFGCLLVAASLTLPNAAWAQAAPPSEAAQAAAAIYSNQDWPAAAEAYRNVVADEPANGLAWLRLGRALTETGDGPAAIEAFERASGAGMQTPFLNVFQARALALMNRDEEMLSTLEAVQPIPALGGAAGLTGFAEFAPYVGNARFDAVVAAFEAAAWPCRADPVSRQFDFWIGEWDVYVGGVLAGYNLVEPMLGDCTLLENWTSVGNRDGKSFNWLDRSSFREPTWRQLWIADQGNTLDYYGGEYRDGAMRFYGHTFNANGDSIPQKLRFENLSPDSVRQVFEQSNDGGATWIVTFDGMYVRRR